MSEDEDCDDLPIITVTASAGDASTFAMPSAEEVASQRARELQCEEELLRLRERDLADQQPADQQPAAGQPAAAPVRSDSSGSEGDATLAAAVTALTVQGRPAPAVQGPGQGPGHGQGQGQPAAALWAALAPRLPPPASALHPHLRGPAHIHYIVASIAATLASEAGEWADEELLCACALLCVAMLAHESQSRRAASRAMHALLDDHASAAQESELAILLLASFPSARTRLQLSDALRSGGGAGADRVAGALTCASMLQLLRPAPAPASAAAWRALLRRASLAHVAGAAAAWRRAAPAAAYACVQLAGRALASPLAPSPSSLAPAPSSLAPAPSLLAPAPAQLAPDPPARALLLTHLAPTTAAGLKLTPDRLKVTDSGSSAPSCVIHSVDVAAESGRVCDVIR